MQFTHVQLLPVMEHPFYASWGYQTTGYFAPTARYGTPQDFMYFVDYLHQRGIGVILDWVPSHFPSDAHGLAYFDGTHLFEHADWRKGFHPDWKTYKEYPGTQTYAEESTAWPMVSKPVYLGGLGFGMKWDMGWMHDTLSYFSQDPIHRGYHHNQLTFRMLYGFTENFVLPLSHDEVVHGKGSLIAKMAGDEWQKFANLRLLYCNQWSAPGKK